MDPTPERFRRLARSAPYRWRALLLEGTWGPFVEAVRVHVERPDRVRVERLDGALLHEARQGSVTGGMWLTSDGSHDPCVPPPPPVPELDEDGLVTAAREPWNVGPEVPMWQDYRFVAVLDPYELSDAVDVLEVRAVEHGGRPAWEAVLRPTPDYSPRCSCCPLMRTRDTDLAEGFDPLPAYAETHLVRLDVGTGVCVLAREVGGPSAGQGHELVLLQATA
ncbi:MAG: uncharacterized protein JWN08_1364 [Frankiales bacterium]|nr:uncharacterized protein [Frankiales bacterium]